MTTPNQADPKYSDAEIRAQADWERRNGGSAITARMMEDYATLRASRPSTPDKAGVSDADEKWLAHIRKELFWRLDMAKSAEARQNANARIDAFDRLVAIATQSAEAVRDGERLAYIGKRGLDNHRYSNHVLHVGGVGDLDDIRTFIDAAMQDREPVTELFEGTLASLSVLSIRTASDEDKAS